MNKISELERQELLKFVDKYEDLFNEDNYDKIFQLFPYGDINPVPLFKSLIEDGTDIIDYMTYVPSGYYSQKVFGQEIDEVNLPKHVVKTEPYAFMGIRKIGKLIINNPNFSFDRGYPFWGCWPDEFVFPNNGLPSAKKKVENAAHNSNWPPADGTICTASDGRAQYNQESNSWKDIA